MFKAGGKPRHTKRPSHLAILPLIRCTMNATLTALRDHPVSHFAAGQTVLEQGTCTGLLYVLIEGEVEVVKDGVRVARTAEPGATFGDLAALLGVSHTAAVRAREVSRFYVLSDPLGFLQEHPPACLHLCKLLARRLDAVNQYLTDVKQQFDGHDHLAMVDGLLDTLMHRQPRTRIPPPQSSLDGPEVTD